MSNSVDKTISYWAENLKITEFGNNRPLNFWDVPSSAREQRKIAYPLMGDDTPELPTIQLLLEKASVGTLKTGISIGCGSGHKELMLIKAGVVKHFTLVELVPELLEAARNSYAKAGLYDRATYVEGDFEQLSGRQYDVVYFDSALHHMFRVSELIPRVLQFLKPGGFFVMDDFVGPTYNQFTEEVYAYAEHVRRLLPQSIFGGGNGGILDNLARISKQAYLDTDPSEACNSSSILPTIAKYMPGVEIIPTGGIIYYLACREIFHKLTEHPDRDDAIIRLLFELDRVLVKANPELTCYALAIWQKRGSNSTPIDGADWKQSIRWPAWGIPL